MLTRNAAITLSNGSALFPVVGFPLSSLLVRSISEPEENRWKRSRWHIYSGARTPDRVKLILAVCAKTELCVAEPIIVI